jgi:putative membrane protein
MDLRRKPFECAMTDVIAHFSPLFFIHKLMRRLNMSGYIVLGLIMAILVTIFAIFNSAMVTVKFFFFETQLSLALVIILSALIGAISVMVFELFSKTKSKKTIKELIKKLETVQADNIKKDLVISELKNNNKKSEMVKE